MAGTMARIEGVVTRGHQVASGSCGDPRFPEGTIRPQIPLLRAAVPGFDAHLGGPAFAGTINVALHGGAELAWWRPEIVVPDVRWTEHLPAETFFLFRAVLDAGGQHVPSFLYLPDPVTKPDHPQPPGIVEMLARQVHDLNYGCRVTIHYDPSTIGFAVARGSRP